MHDHRQQVALRIYCDVPLAPLDFLARVVTAPPPFSAVLADCESIIATVGVAFRLPCGPVREASALRAPTRRCRARRENAHELFSREENHSATDATDNRFSPHKAVRPPPVAAHASAAGLRRDVRLGARSTLDLAWTTACPSDHSGT